MARRKSPWRLVLESYPCRTCAAKVGEPCRSTVTGRPTTTIHMDRVNSADRCTRCGERIDPGGGQLCPRCALVRSLEIERATKYRRTE